MAKDINLLPDITLNEEKEAKQQKLLTIISMAILIVGAVGLLGAITVDLTMGEILQRTQNENNELKKTVQNYADVELTQRAIKAKLSTSSNILNTAKDFKTDLQNLEALLPENGITIQTIAIDKTNKVSLSGKASTSESFNQYINNILNNEKGGKFFTDINLGTVSTIRDGSLQFNLTMQLKKAEATQ